MLNFDISNKKLNFSKWLHELKNEFKYMPWDSEELERNLIDCEKSSNPQERDLIEFYKMFLRHYPLKRKKRGTIKPSLAYMEIVWLGLELAKGDTLLLEKMKAIFTHRQKNNEECIGNWTGELTKSQPRKYIPYTIAPSEKKESKSTTWANDMKYAYKQHLRIEYQKLDFPTKNIKANPSYRPQDKKCSEEFFLETVCKKWLDKIT